MVCTNELLIFSYFIEEECYHIFNKTPAEYLNIFIIGPNEWIENKYLYLTKNVKIPDNIQDKYNFKYLKGKQELEQHFNTNIDNDFINEFLTRNNFLNNQSRDESYFNYEKFQILQITLNNFLDCEKQMTLINLLSDNKIELFI